MRPCLPVVQRFRSHRNAHVAPRPRGPSARAALPATYVTRCVLSQASTPFQSVTYSHHMSCFATASARKLPRQRPDEHAHLLRFSSLQRLSPGWSHLTRPHSHTNVTLRPQVFSPSRRFAPQPDFWVYFAPVPLLGFALQGFTPHPVPLALPSLASFLTFNFPTEMESPAPSRLNTQSRSRPTPLVIHRQHLRCPLELFLLQGFLSTAANAPRYALSTERALRNAAPLMHFLAAIFTLIATPVLQGFLSFQRSPSLSTWA